MNDNDTILAAKLARLGTDHLNALLHAKDHVLFPNNANAYDVAAYFVASPEMRKVGEEELAQKIVVDRAVRADRVRREEKKNDAYDELEKLTGRIADENDVEFARFLRGALDARLMGEMQREDATDPEYGKHYRAGFKAAERVL